MDALIQERDGELYVGPSRVLVSVIAAYFEQGQTPEQIHDGLPSISLAEVLGTIDYYLEHKDELDGRFTEDQRLADERWATYRAAHTEFFDAMHARFEAVRKRRREQAEQLHEATEA